MGLRDKLLSWRPWWRRTDREICKAFKIKPDDPMLKRIRENADRWDEECGYNFMGS